MTPSLHLWRCLARSIPSARALLVTTLVLAPLASELAVARRAVAQERTHDEARWAERGWTERGWTERGWTERAAVAAALETSPDARAARADRRSAEAALRATRGARRPTLSISGTGGHTESLASSVGGAIVRQQQDTVALTSSSTLVTDLGTTVDLGLSTNVGWRTMNLNPASTTLNTIGPIYTTSLTVGLRQPLLRGAGDDATLGPERQARASARASALTLRQTVSTSIRDVLVAHRELAHASASVRVSEEARALAVTQHEQARAREALGTGTHLDVLRYASALATAESNLRATRASEEQAALTLGTLLGLAPSDARSLRVEDTDDAAATVTSLELLLDRAAGSSAELAALEAQIEAARELERTRADADQVQLDLVGQLAAGLVYNGATLDTLSLPDGRPALGGSLGLELSLPLGPGQAHAQHEQASADLDAAIARYEARLRGLAEDVASERAAWQSADERASLAEAARRSAHELAEAERSGLVLGTVTSLELVQAQQDERAAELTALRARADRRVAEIRLAHLTGSLLDAFDVELRASEVARRGEDARAEEVSP